LWGKELKNVKIFLEFSDFGREYLRVWPKNSVQRAADSGQEIEGKSFLDVDFADDYFINLFYHDLQLSLFCQPWKEYLISRKPVLPALECRNRGELVEGQG